MKAFWLREIRQLVQSASFQQWWGELRQLYTRLEELNERLEQLQTEANMVAFRAESTQKKAISLLYRAGEYEDRAAQLLADGSEIENKSYEAVATFESQRIFVSDLYSRMGAMEHRLLSVQSELKLLEEAMNLAREKDEQKELERQIRRKKTRVGTSPERISGSGHLLRAGKFAQDEPLGRGGAPLGAVSGYQPAGFRVES